MTRWYHNGPLGERESSGLGCDMNRHFRSILHFQCSHRGRGCGSEGKGEEEVLAFGRLLLFHPCGSGNHGSFWPPYLSILEGPWPLHHRGGKITLLSLSHSEGICGQIEGKFYIHSGDHRKVGIF